MSTKTTKPAVDSKLFVRVVDRAVDRATGRPDEVRVFVDQAAADAYINALPADRRVASHYPFPCTWKGSRYVPDMPGYYTFTPGELSR